MLSETRRPVFLDDVVGHEDPKRVLKSYLQKSPYLSSVFLTGTPGIGKTTLALCAARTCGFEVLEINASRSIRSFTDVEKLKDACRSAVNIHSFIRNEVPKRTCVILDEVDGSDPHAQRKIVEWLKDPERRVPILFTGNDVPMTFKRNTDLVQIVRCYPPRSSDLTTLFPGTDILPFVKECQHDVRRLFHRIQYGESYIFPKYVLPPTGLSTEETFLRKQAMFGLEDVLSEYRGGKQGNARSS